MSKMGATITPHTSLTGCLSVACGRISYTFGLSGPSASIDTACSSSLVCTHIGNSLLNNSETDSSFAAGITQTLVAQSFALFQVSGMLAADGRCKTLDQRGDGYVRAEACGAVQVKPMTDDDDAKACLLHVAGSTVNQDGRSSSLTAPNGP